MKRYAKFEYVNAEQWSDCDNPPDAVFHYTDEVVETALVNTTQPVYAVNCGPSEVQTQIRCKDWILYLNDGTKEVMSDAMFSSTFIESDKLQKALDSLEGKPSA